MMNDDGRRLARLEDAVASLRQSILLNHRVTREIMTALKPCEIMVEVSEPVYLIEPST
jgi:hypothetical protein